jgi:hypothetical protein
MVSEPTLVHTQILDQMADSSNTATGAVATTPSPTPPLAENTISLPIPNIHSHIAPKVQLDEQNYMAWVFQF